TLGSAIMLAQKLNRPRLLKVATGLLTCLACWLNHKFTRTQGSPGRSSVGRSPHTGAPITIILACHGLFEMNSQTIGARRKACQASLVNTRTDTGRPDYVDGLLPVINTRLTTSIMLAAATYFHHV